MYYLFNKEGKCFGTIDFAPNFADLATRDEIAVELDEVYDIARIQLKNGKVEELPKVESPSVIVEPKEERIELDNLKVLEILAAQQEQIDALMEGK